MDSKSGPAQQVPLRVVVLALEPQEGHTPAWARIAGLGHTHIVLAVGDRVWDQPWKGKGSAYTTEEWSDHHIGEGRGWSRVDINLDDHDPWAWMDACQAIEGRRTQRLRTVLRFLHLWPKPAFNCTTPVRILLNSLGFEITGETPDDILEELAPDRSDSEPSPGGPAGDLG